MKPHIPLLERLIDKKFHLVDGTDEIFELDLALWEHEVLSQQELIQRSAYFKLVDGKESVHFQTCNLQNLEDIHKDSSFRTKVFFLSGKYSTGYATHGIFPYRGKFHPQLIRALLNILQVQPGQIVLDPMAGSSTVAVEANLLGIDSISVDLSPFCQLIGKVKTFGLDLDIKILESFAKDSKKLFKSLNKEKVPKYFASNGDSEKRNYYEVILLAFLDAMGFASRSKSSIEKLFPRVLERYVLTIKNFQKAKKTMKLKIGHSQIIEGSVLDLPLEENCADVIITSPPYSFAINYLKNDQPQLEYLGYKIEDMKNGMIGLQGIGVKNKLEIYFDQMNRALGEMRRVSKMNVPIVIIIGTNDIQTGGVNLQKKVIELARNQGVNFEFELIKPIRGLQNTMKEESILFFRNG